MFSLVSKTTSYLATAGGGFSNVLVIGADALSRYVDWTDRGTCILFGDAAGAVLMQVKVLLQTMVYNSEFLWLSLWYMLYVESNFILFQACDSEDDGLFGFDLHSDGDGQRYVFLIFFLVPFYHFVSTMIESVNMKTGI